MAGKGGGAWKVAYADFVTAMMAFFLVMWITSQSEPVREAVAQHFREPYRASKSAKEGDAPPPFLKRTSSGRYPPASSRPSVSEEAFPMRQRPPAMRTGDGDRTHIGAAVLFAEESATLDAAAEESLRSLAPQLAGKPQRIEIRGYSSRKPPDPNGPFGDSWRLCYARCQATLDFLKQLGIPEHRMRLSQAGAYHRPHGGDVDGPAMESRVEVFLLSEIVPAAEPSRQPSAHGEPVHADSPDADPHL